ncbi:MAG: carbon monoxide dehydrogenase, partial [Ahrensia sp.]|nr:carbon monoxide dehydrogenase [Ahrensia sp.]
MNAVVGIGSSPKRKEDARFVRGKGTYVADIKRPNMLAGVFLRSEHAHAKLNSVDVSKALAQPGVKAVYTGEDMKADNVGGLPVGWGITDKHGDPMKEPPHPPI